MLIVNWIPGLSRLPPKLYVYLRPCPFSKCWSDLYRLWCASSPFLSALRLPLFGLLKDLKVFLHLLAPPVSNCDRFSILIYLLIYSTCDGKAEFSASLLQSSLSHDLSENILICCFDAQDTFLIIINVENVMLLNIFMEVIEK